MTGVSPKQKKFLNCFTIAQIRRNRDILSSFIASIDSSLLFCVRYSILYLTQVLALPKVTLEGIPRIKINEDPEYEIFTSVLFGKRFSNYAGG